MQKAFLAIAFSVGIAGQAQALVCHDDSVTGVVSTTHSIKLRAFECVLSHANSFVFSNKDYRDTRPIFTLNVRFKNAADTEQMIPGRVVTLRGDFRTDRINHVDYLSVSNAEISH
jgi:hypothetical protein